MFPKPLSFLVLSYNSDQHGIYPETHNIPANTRHSPSVGLILAQRRVCWDPTYNADRGQQAPQKVEFLKTRNIDSVSVECWASVADGGPACK